MFFKRPKKSTKMRRTVVDIQTLESISSTKNSFFLKLNSREATQSKNLKLNTSNIDINTNLQISMFYKQNKTSNLKSKSSKSLLSTEDNIARKQSNNNNKIRNVYKNQVNKIKAIRFFNSFKSKFNGKSAIGFNKSTKAVPNQSSSPANLFENQINWHKLYRYLYEIADAKLYIRKNKEKRSVFDRLLQQKKNDESTDKDVEMQKLSCNDLIACNRCDRGIKIQKVYIQIMLLNIQDIDSALGICTVELALKMIWKDIYNSNSTEDSRSNWNPQVTLENAMSKKWLFYNLSRHVDTNGQPFYVEMRRVRASFVSFSDIYTFPFDVQKFSIYLLCDSPSNCFVDLLSNPEEPHIISTGRINSEYRLYDFVEEELINGMDAERNQMTRESVQYKLLGDCRPRLKLSYFARHRSYFFVYNFFAIQALLIITGMMLFAMSVHEFRVTRQYMALVLLYILVCHKLILEKYLICLTHSTAFDNYLMFVFCLLICMIFYNSTNSSIYSGDGVWSMKVRNTLDQIVYSFFQDIIIFFAIYCIFWLIFNPLRETIILRKKEEAFKNKIKRNIYKED